MFIQPSKHFGLPRDGSASMIMIGPGTGIAPFRAFLHDRRATGAKGRNWLFFGDQRQSHDFLYRDELETLLTDGSLHRLDTAFSRDQLEKVYVQHRMAECGAELWKWLNDGAHLYVCGDARRMAKDVDDALRRIVAEHGGMSDDNAKAYLSDLSRQNRYQRDIY
jgi:sulfite reductase (NADPH) flavoprotein alpha-component